MTISETVQSCTWILHSTHSHTLLPAGDIALLILLVISNFTPIPNLLDSVIYFHANRHTLFRVSELSSCLFFLWFSLSSNNALCLLCISFSISCRCKKHHILNMIVQSVVLRDTSLFIGPGGVTFFRKKLRKIYAPCKTTDRKIVTPARVREEKS